MPPRKEPEKPSSLKRRQPATTPTDREQQMIELADQFAEKQMLEGTAPAQIVTHYLKLGTSRERAEQERLHLESLKVKAQIAQIEAQTSTAELMERVMVALKVYSGADDDNEEL